MSPLHLVRFQHPQQGVRIGVIDGETLMDVTRSYPTIGAFLRASSGRIEAALADLRGAMHASIDRYPASALDATPEPDALRWLAPCDEQDVWASGVTYERSRAARQEEAVDGGDVYARVYAAERPELFFKARGERVVGHGDTVGIRTDATWNVPEPELALVITPALEVIGFTVGNDMSSRDIEGENPLYLPQAKVYKRSCALGPSIVLSPSIEWPNATIRITISRGGAPAFSGETHTARIKRRLTELTDYLGRSAEYPDGAVLLTGTGVVPPNEFTLAAGDEVAIEIEGVGRLVNTVVVV